MLIAFTDKVGHSTNSPFLAANVGSVPRVTIMMFFNYESCIIFSVEAEKQKKKVCAMGCLKG